MKVYYNFLALSIVLDDFLPICQTVIYQGYLLDELI